MSAGLADVHIWTGKNWMRYYAGHVATMSLLLSQNGLIEAISEHLIFDKIPGESMPPHPLVLHAYASIHAHQTPLLKILAKGLMSIMLIDHQKILTCHYFQ